MALRIFDKLLFGTDDHRQRLRLRRFFMACVGYIMWVGIVAIAIFAYRLQIQSNTFLYLVTGIFISQLVFFVFLRSGLNRRSAMPAMTLPQMLVALVWVLIVMTLVHEIRSLLISVYMVILLFGIFELDKKQFALLSVIAFSGYLLLVIIERTLGSGLYAPQEQILALLVLTGLLCWTAFFGTYVSNLRYRLGLRNEEMEQALGRIQELAEHDELTGIYNRRYIMNVLERLKAVADRGQDTFSLCIMDLDHFKAVNDNYGHVAGDQALIDFTRLAKQTLRGMDIIGLGDAAAPSRLAAPELTSELTSELTMGRYGGEEFMVVLPATDIEGAWQCAERLRSEQLKLAMNNPGIAVTLSAGVAEYSADESLSSLLRRVDTALYRAKANGRNRVEIALDNDDKFATQPGAV